MSSLRIDLVLESGGGGSGRHVLDLFGGLIRRGHDARLILSMVRADASFIEEVASLPGDRVIDLPMQRSVGPGDLGAAMALRRISAGRDLIHAHSTKAGIVGAIASPGGPPMVLTPHAYRGMDLTLASWKAAAIRVAERTLSAPYRRIIAVSPNELDYARDRLGIAPSRLIYIPNGIDVGKWAALATPKPAPGAPYRIGFVGRLAEQKNPLAFIEVLAALVSAGEPVTATLVGDGPLLGAVKSLAADRDVADRIDYRGWVRGTETLDGIDVLVHTSNYESLPYGLLEAMAAGVPIAPVSNAGTELLLWGVYSRLPSPSDTEALTEQILRLRHDPRYAATTAEASARVVAEYSLDTMVDTIVSLYEQVLGRDA